MENYFYSIFTTDNIQSVYDFISLFYFFSRKVWSSLKTWLSSEKGFLLVLKSPYIATKDLG
jgi:hypothetical protein